ncbi:hypothetical protein [Methanospirillum lacunae]|uniref:Uncharacterized protein n=1 Tax=Methanospirillum lacunae TaxID=668570 RepID=A0A2V2MYB5_9EURY|nr:hypothetical protein [Methanospirillum lacunae]PWR71295.1 hypothetical protein DK846_10525 [Methanospirillum lacunae]
MKTGRSTVKYPPADEQAWWQIIEGDGVVLPFVWLSISFINGCGLLYDIIIQGIKISSDYAYPVVQ